MRHNFRMHVAQLHPQESERVESLQKLEIMDSISEKEFDEIAKMASQICDTPIALISLLDNSRQWFKAKIGLAEVETKKDISFCSHAILQDEVFIVNDAQADERFYDNPLVINDPKIRFYAGAVLKSPEKNLPIGTLCVVDHVPRELSQNQIESLKALSHQLQKLLELRLRVLELQSKNKSLLLHKLTFENMVEGLILQDREKKIIDSNASVYSILGFSANQFITDKSSADGWRAIHEDGSDFSFEEHPSKKALEIGLIQKNVIMGIEKKLGELKWISLTATPLFLSPENFPSHVVTTFSDITEQKIAQQALMQSAKLSSLGEMAGGIAHEVNTPLAIICLLASRTQKMLKLNPIPTEDINEKLIKIEATGYRISKIVKGLLAFSRNTDKEPWTETSLAQTITDALSLCNEKLKNSQIQFNMRIESDLSVYCVSTQISQVILNLLQNAHDAIQDLPQKWIRIELEKFESQAKITVTDSGCGINPYILDKIMQPFFTTKETGRGSGLGLSISKGIAEKFKGRLYYNLDQGHTSFVLELPLLESISNKSA